MKMPLIQSSVRLNELKLFLLTLQRGVQCSPTVTICCSCWFTKVLSSEIFWIARIHLTLFESYNLIDAWIKVWSVLQIVKKYLFCRCHQFSEWFKWRSEMTILCCVYKAKLMAQCPYMKNRCPSRNTTLKLMQISYVYKCRKIM